MMGSLALGSVSFWGSSRSVIKRDYDHDHGQDQKMKMKMMMMKKRSRVGMAVAMAMAGGAKFKGTQMKEKQLNEMIEKKVKEATEVCEGDEKSAECKVAWDEVEEISQAKADFRLKLQKEDPLESFCQENPETDECRLYDN